MSRNITLSLDEEIIQKIRVVAARRGMSVSSMLRDQMRRLVQKDDKYGTARDQARRRLARGSHLGGGRLPAREELHDRAKLR